MEEEKHSLRKYLNGHEHRVHRNTDDKDHPDRGSDANEKFVIRQWRKDHPCHKVPKTMAELYSSCSVLRKAELANNEMNV